MSDSEKLALLLKVLKSPKKCRQQVKENVDTICGPLPKFND